VGTGVYDTSVVGTAPLALGWRIVTASSGTRLEATFGPTLLMTWLLDDGATRHGLTDPANPDNVGYQNGSLDLGRVVPVLYTHWAAGNVGDVQPEATLELALDGHVPQLTDLVASTPTGVPVTFTVSGVDSAGTVDPSYGRTVTFSSSDPAAQLPAPYAFQPGDLGSHRFTATFSTPGAVTLVAVDAALPALRSSAMIDVGAGDTVEHRYRVGCGCNQAAAVVPLWLALWPRRRRRAVDDGQGWSA
jgi:hypothetical protein